MNNQKHTLLLLTSLTFLLCSCEKKVVLATNINFATTPKPGGNSCWNKLLIQVVGKKQVKQGTFVL